MWDFGSSKEAAVFAYDFAISRSWLTRLEVEDHQESPGAMVSDVSYPVFVGLSCSSSATPLK